MEQSAQTVGFEAQEANKSKEIGSAGFRRRFNDAPSSGDRYGGFGRFARGLGMGG
jgi:hypothetical protein